MRETKKATSHTKKRLKTPIPRKFSVEIQYLNTDTSRFAQLMQKYKLLKAPIVVILLVSGLVTLPIWLPVLMGVTVKKTLDTPPEKAASANEPKTSPPFPTFFIIGVWLAMIIATLASGAILLGAWRREALCFRASRYDSGVCFGMNTEPVSFVLGVFLFYIVFWFSAFFVSAIAIKLSREGSPSAWR